MESQSSKTGWLFQLKRKILFSILCVLTITITVTMVFVAITLRNTLAVDSKDKTTELAVAINTTLHHLMILRTPEAIQETLISLVAENKSVSKALILNRQSVVTYSSDINDIGQTLNRYEESSCRICHDLTSRPTTNDSVLLIDNGQTHRNITLISNEKSCHECHDPTLAINGKLIIDRSLASTTELITRIELILFGSGLICLIILVPIFSRTLSHGINQYIVEISSRNEELHLLYFIVERLSKTLDMELLKEIVIEIFKDVLNVDELELYLPKGEQNYSASVWSIRTGQVSRKRISAGAPEERTLKDWFSGQLKKTTVSADYSEICMPIQKNGHNLALIIAKKKDGFEKSRLELNPVINSHIAVAFDNARLYYIAITDEMTQTFTKRHFRRCIDDAFTAFERNDSKFALLMMDLDKFKQVNDVHGHVAGDEVLKQLGEVIRLSIRENDLPFRYGGEEFAVILPEATVEDAIIVAERIRATTEATLFVSGQIKLRLTISIGVATCSDALSVHDLIVAADKALYRAKAQGRNRVVVSEKVFGSSPL